MDPVSFFFFKWEAISILNASVQPEINASHQNLIPSVKISMVCGTVLSLTMFENVFEILRRRPDNM